MIDKKIIAKVNRESYLFLKEKYLDLILHFTKHKDDKSVEFLKNSWQEIEKQYQN